MHSFSAQLIVRVGEYSKDVTLIVVLAVKTKHVPLYIVALDLFVYVWGINAIQTDHVGETIFTCI